MTQTNSKNLTPKHSCTPRAPTSPREPGHALPPAPAPLLHAGLVDWAGVSNLAHLGKNRIGPAKHLADFKIETHVRFDRVK